MAISRDPVQDSLKENAPKDVLHVFFGICPKIIELIVQVKGQAVGMSKSNDRSMILHRLNR